MFRLIELLIGRRLLWRLARRAYLHARREGSLDMAVNGEAWLQRAFAKRSARERLSLCIIDVGANYGQWSNSMLTALREAGAPSPAMTLFEPIPAIRAKLAEKLASQSLVDLRIEPFAVSDEPGSMTMSVHEVSAGTHHLGRLEPEETGTESVVEVVTLDDYWAERGGGTIHFVKIDAEGYDSNILFGMRGLMTAGAVDAIQLEYSVLFFRTRTFLRDIIETARSCGYRYGNLHRTGIELLDHWHPDVESFCSSTKVLLHPRAVEWLGARTMTYSRHNTLMPV